MEEDIKIAYEKFRDKGIMVTGGMGFIGSNLARRLSECSPKRLIIVDSMIKGLGATRHNLDGIEDKVEIPGLNAGGLDIRDSKEIRGLLQDIDYVFNLAGSVSHIDSKNRPLNDLEINLESHVSFLESCREVMKKRSGGLKVLFTATRDVYGKVREEDLPVREDQKIYEVSDPQGIHNHASEFHHFWYAKNFGFDAISLRLTNTYGPRQKLDSPEHGFMGWFIRQAIESQTIELWGGGTALRDFNYVDDVVDALLMTMASERTSGEVYNLGSYIKKLGKYEDVKENISTVSKVAEEIVRICGSGKCLHKEYPPEKKSIEVGHFCADATKIYKTIGWAPRTSLQEGIAKTIEFYKKNKEHYW
jgi:UDP-glucose 4-epimerase